MIKFASPDIGEEEAKAAYDTLLSGWVVAGKKTEEFEKEFAKFVGVKHAIFTNSCTSALKMAYKYFKEQGRDKYCLLTGRNTYCATYAAAEEMGLRPVDYNIRPTETVAVVVHYGGVKDERVCDIEDSAHRIEPNDPLTGQIRCYSFYATKNMTTIQGGMFVTNDDAIYEKARLWWKDGLSTSTKDRMEGKGYDYEVKALAGGYDSNDVCAAIGLVQLKKLPKMNFRREIIVNTYNEAFDTHWTGKHLYPYEVGVKNVADFYNFMKENGIQCGYHYPGTEWPSVSLPLNSKMTDEEVEYVIEKVKEYANRTSQV